MSVVSSFFKKILSSSGVKRAIASALAVLYGILPLFPGVQPLITAVEALAGYIGGVGVVHAVSVGTLSKAKLSSLSSVFSLILLIAQYVPALQPYIPIIEKIAELFGALAIGNMVAAKQLLKS